jgi:hypothetical protein
MHARCELLYAVQVVNALLCAKLSGLEAVPRGGGHGYEGDFLPLLIPKHIDHLT